MIRELKFSLIAGCALAAAATPVMAQQELPGRLFFTPAQRASLDVARTQRARALLYNENPEQEAVPAPQTIIYGGVVRRSDGKSTAWFNNKPVNDREPLGGAAIVGRVRPDGGVTLQVLQSGRNVSLKPGQSVELLSGAVEEGYSRKLEAPKPEPVATPAADGKGAKPASLEAAKAEREREERQQQVIEDAVSRALQETAAARPGAAAPAETLR